MAGARRSARADAPRLKVRAAVLRHFPPQYDTDPNGEPRGFAIDTLQAIAESARS